MRRSITLAILVMLGKISPGGLANHSAAMRWAWRSAWFLAFWPASPPPCSCWQPSSRRRHEEEEARAERYDRDYQQRHDRQLPAYPYQPPVIRFVAGGGQAQQPGAPMGSAPYDLPRSLHSGFAPQRAPLQGRGGA